MKKVKKVLGVLLAVLMLTSAAAGCSQNGGSTSSGEPSAQSGESQGEASEGGDEEFEISISHWMLSDANFNPGPAYMEKVNEEFQKVYPNGKIVWNELSGEKYHELLKAQLAAKTAPDIFGQNGLTVIPFAEAGYTVDLTGKGWDDRMRESCMADCAVDGKIYAIPLDVGGWGINYSKDAFDQCDIKTPPKDWAELLEICETLKANGITPINVGLQDEWPASGIVIAFASFIYGQNEDMASQLWDGKANFNGPEFKDVFNAIQELYDKGYIDPGIMSTTYAQATDQLYAGEIGMMFNSTILTDGDIGFLNIPDAQGKTYMTTGTNSMLSINSECENQEAALAALQAMTEPDTVKLFLKDSFAGLNDVETEQTSVCGQEYAAALERDISMPQINMWFPSSAQDIMAQTVSQIFSGAGYTEDDLNAMQSAYEKDKDLVLIH